MARQITFGSADIAVRTLEHRVEVLERHVAALTEALRVMAMAVEDTPSGLSDDARSALRQARELLLPQPPSSR
ncbi:hypothetical protein GCM10009527_027950 [Actinomadura nitritigenes]|jgi:hypothetical protein|uniref:Uncharacterized protein n=1 Tax=Actinomadura nitritigenes TaxID=134602 RepID=A0ABS3RCX6_9ACTN|nr:hypothetical protein [Actinomadura nitritigenes]MBO2443468.1 hypothetical protein [Actinomadura nitritigenes]